MIHGPPYYIFYFGICIPPASLVLADCKLTYYHQVLRISTLPRYQEVSLRRWPATNQSFLYSDSARVFIEINYKETPSWGRTMVDRSGRTCQTRGEMKIKSQKCFYILFHGFCVPPTAILPSAIILPIMAVQKRSGAAPSKPNTGPTGPIFACARAQDLVSDHCWISRGSRLSRKKKITASQ